MRSIEEMAVTHIHQLQERQNFGTSFINCGLLTNYKRTQKCPKSTLNWYKSEG